MAKSFDDIVSDLIDNIKSAFSPVLIDTRIGSVIRDAIIGPTASEVEQLSLGIDDVSNNQSVLNASNMTNTNMESLAANYGVTRKSGTRATGVVRFVKFAVPTGIIEIPAGTKVATRETNQFSQRIFRTLSAVQLTPTSPADPVTGAAASVDVSVQSDDVGVTGNVDANTIQDLISSIAGIDRVFNPSPLIEGSEEQGNEELAAVVSARAQGRLGTETGYEDLVLNNFSITDIVVVGPADPEATRSQFGGAVDVVVIGKELIQTAESFLYTGQTVIKPTVLPLVSTVTLTGFSGGGTPTTFVGPATGVGPGTDFDVVLDTTGPFSGSFQEKSRLDLHFVTATPDIGSFLTLTYNNNQLIRSIQSFLSAEQNNVLGSNVLAKAGIEINAEVEADIRIIPGFDSTVVEFNAGAAVNAFFNALQFGVDVQSSDVVTAIGNVAGVDFVDLTTFELRKAGDPAVLQEIVAKKQEFIRASLVDITVL
jgi:uncharacterized phage protein gp47/JayE